MYFDVCWLLKFPIQQVGANRPDRPNQLGPNWKGRVCSRPARQIEVVVAANPDYYHEFGKHRREPQISAL
jgi:hypothetical protein